MVMRYTDPCTQDLSDHYNLSSVLTAITMKSVLLRTHAEFVLSAINFDCIRVDTSIVRPVCTLQLGLLLFAFIISCVSMFFTYDKIVCSSTWLWCHYQHTPQRRLPQLHTWSGLDWPPLVSRRLCDRTRKTLWKFPETWWYIQRMVRIYSLSDRNIYRSQL